MRHCPHPNLAGFGLAAIAGDFDPHHGPVIIAAERLKRFLDVDEKAAPSINGLIEGFAALHGISFPVEGIPLPKSDAEYAIGQELFKICGRLHFIAHDVIIAAYALMAVRENGTDLPESLIKGICGNLSKMDAAPPGIFHRIGTSEIAEMEPLFSGFDSQATEHDLVRILCGFLRSVPESYPGFGFRVQETHALTHTHALIWLRRHGFEAVYQRGLKPWFLRMSLLAPILEKQKPPIQPAPFEPVGLGSREFWSRIDGRHGDQHLLKAALSLLELKEWGLLAEEDFRFILDSKFPVLFSRVEGEFSN